MILCLFIIIAAFLLPIPAYGQNSWLDYSTATLEWTWSEGQGLPIPDGFRAKCGRQSKVYTIVTEIPGAAIRSVLISKVTNGMGIWFCVIAAFNKSVESPPSNEVDFDARSIVLSPSIDKAPAIYRKP